MIGHLLGAAGGVEAVFSVLAIKDNILPPTINLNNQDPECDLDYVPKIAREKKLKLLCQIHLGLAAQMAH